MAAGQRLYRDSARRPARSTSSTWRRTRRPSIATIPEKIGGYPVNYGIVPQTISYDGDPFDVLVLGPAIPTGQLVKGVDRRPHAHGGRDRARFEGRDLAGSAPTASRTHQLTDADRKRMADLLQSLQAR